MGFVMLTETIGNLSEAMDISIDQALSYQPSGFFPTPQRETVENLQFEPAVKVGAAVPPSTPGIPSINQTLGWFLGDWYGSPYEKELGTPSAKAAESKALADVITGPADDPYSFVSDIFKKLEGGLSWAIDTKQSAGTLWDELKSDYSARPPVTGGDVSETHQNELTKMGAEVYGAGQKMVDQVKGLFNLGFPQDEKQGVVGFAAGDGAGLSIGLILVVAIIAVILWKRK